MSFNHLITAALMTIGLVVFADDIDTFNDAAPQTAPNPAISEIATVEAIGGFRFISAGFPANVVTVNGGTANCSDGGFGIGTCVFIYDGILDGAGNINGGGLAGASILSAGQTELTINVANISGMATFNFEIRDMPGNLCQLSIGNVTAPGSYSVPLSDDADCAPGLANLGGIQLTVFIQPPPPLAKGPGATVTFDMLESTPVSLESFSVE